MRRAVVITVVSLLALTVLACSPQEPHPAVGRNATAIKALEEVVSDFRAEVRSQAEEQEANLRQTLDDQLDAIAALQEKRLPTAWRKFARAAAALPTTPSTTG